MSILDLRTRPARHRADSPLSRAMDRASTTHHRLGQPPASERTDAGTWRPGSAHDVRVAVTSAALHHATVRYFADPSDQTYAAMLTAQTTAEDAR